MPNHSGLKYVLVHNTLHSNAEEATEVDASTLNSEDMKVR